MSVTAVIAEDESLLRDQLGESLASAWPELDIVARTDDGRQAIAALEKHRPDVMFLDMAVAP